MSYIWKRSVFKLFRLLPVFQKTWFERGVRLNPSNPLSLRLWYAHMCVCMYVCAYSMYISYVCIYMCFVCTHILLYAYAYVASRLVEELQILDSQKCPVVVNNRDKMNLSFLLCSSGNFCSVFKVQQVLFSTQCNCIHLK